MATNSIIKMAKNYLVIGQYPIEHYFEIENSLRLLFALEVKSNTFIYIYFNNYVVF